MKNTESFNLRLTLSLVTTILTGLTLLAQTAPAQQWTTNNLPPGLISWWNADGNTLDVTGLNPAGGSGQTYGPGRFGQTFHFNGINQSVAAPGSASLDQWTQFTLEAWMKLDKTEDVAGGAPGRMVINRVGNATDHENFNQGYQFGFWDNARRLVVNFNTNGQAWSGFATEAVLAAPLPTNVWLHYAATYDHNAVMLYLNGVPLKTNVIGAATVAHSTSAFRIGMDDNGNCPFPGSIDDVRVYNRALSAAEIAHLFAGPPLAGLISWWRGEGDASDTMGGHHGTAQGGVSYPTAKVGSGFFFDSNEDRVDVPHADALNPGAGGFTAQFWMRGTRAQPNYLNGLLDKSHSFTDSTGWALSCWTNNGQVECVIGQGGGGSGNFQAVRSQTDVLDGGFHQVTAVWTGTEAQLFVDGTLEAHQTMSPPANNTRPLCLGYVWGGGVPQRFFRGALDEVMIFNRALSAAEIASLYVTQGGALQFSIQPASGGVLLSWPASAEGFGLVSRPDLTAGNWEAVTNVPVLNGTRKEVLLPANTPAQRFFRLAQ